MTTHVGGKLESKPCVVCGKAMLRMDVGNRDWPKRKYCSVTCCGIANIGKKPAPRKNPVPKPPPKACLRCGALYHKPPYSSQMRWDKRKFCSGYCGCRSGARDG